MFLVSVQVAAVIVLLPILTDFHNPTYMYITSFSLIIITFFGNLNANTKSIKSIDLNIIGGFSATIIPVRHCACIDIASAHEG